MTNKITPSYAEQREEIVEFVMLKTGLLDAALTTIVALLKNHGVEDYSHGHAVEEIAKRDSVILYAFAHLAVSNSVDAGMAAMIKRLEGADAAQRFLDDVDLSDACMCDKCMRKMVYGTHQAD